MFRFFISQNNQPVAGLDPKYLSGLLGKYDLSAFAYADGSEYMLALRRYALASLLLVVMDQVVEFHIIQFCQCVAVQNVRN